MHSRKTRLRILGTLMSALLLLLVARLWWLQLTQWSEYAAKAVGNRTQVTYRPAPRGLIRDRTGLTLAENRDVWSLRVLPTTLPRDQVLLEKCAQFLTSTLATDHAPVTLPEIREALLEARRTGAVDAVPLGNLGEDLDFDQVASIEEHRLEYPGFSVVTTTRRHYPYGRLAAHVVGYTRPIDADRYERVNSLCYPAAPNDPTITDAGATIPDVIYARDAVVGAEGVEEAAEIYASEAPDAPSIPVLQGRRGRAVHEVDATGVPQRLIAERRPAQGAEVWLTLDARVQMVAEQALRTVIRERPDGMAAAVVIDVNTGDVLAMASEPALDPNDWVAGLSSAQWQQAQEDKGLPFLNKALRSYPPGSIFKIVSVCAAMETTNVETATTSHCKGLITVGRRHEAYRCWAAARGGHGTVDLTEAIARSCNIFFYDCVTRFRLEAGKIARYSRYFKLGETSGLGLRGEVAGRVPDPEFDHPWRLGNTLNYVIGQDRLTVTPVQMAVVTAALANGGRLVRPRIIQRVVWPPHLRHLAPEPEKPHSEPLSVKPETVEAVRRGMRMAVVGEHGTAGRLRDLGVSAAGKTGSAQHHPRRPTHSWAVAFAPYDNPRYALSVFVASGGTGGEVAIPIAGRIMRALFQVHDPEDPEYTLPAPDDPDTTAAKRRGRVEAARTRGAATAPPAPESPES